MAQDKVNVGVYANDGTGDPLRGAFIKLNDDFTEAFSDLSNTSNSVANLTSNVLAINAHTFLVIQEFKNDTFFNFTGVYANTNNLSNSTTISIAGLNSGFANLTGIVSNNSNTVVTVNNRIDSLTTTVATLNLYHLMDVSVTEGPSIDKKYLMWNDTAGRWVANSIVPDVYLSTLLDVNITPGSGINGYSLVYDDATGKWIAVALVSTLDGLVDVSVVEDETSNNKYLMWSQSSGHWVANAIPSPALTSLTDVNITETAADDGKTIKFDYATSKWVTSNSYIYDVGSFCAGICLSDERIFQFNVVRPFMIAANCEGSTATAANTASANATFTIYQNSSNVGTMFFEAGQANAVFRTSSFLPITLAIGDYLRVVAPSSADITLADFSFTFKGVTI